MGWGFFFVVMVVVVVMLFLSAIKLFFNLLGNIAIFSLFFGTLLFFVHCIIKHKRGKDNTVTMIPVVMFWLLGIAIVVWHVVSCKQNGTDIDLLRFFFFTKSIW